MRGALAITWALAVLTCGTVAADDWPMYRYDSARSGHQPVALPADLHLQWVRQLPEPRPAYSTHRMQFDGGYEPIVSGSRMYFGSTLDDSVTALETRSGRILWRYFTDGPVRLAPVAWRDRILAGSDDGYLHCLAADTGQLIWKFRAAPSERRVLGNGRLISLWPVRGGPVVQDDRVYLAAGVWPFEGTFLYCLDAETGKTIWTNDESGFIYGQHPHAAEAFGGVTPQGYLVINGDELVVPCGQAFPATFNRHTGKLVEFELPRPGRLPGGWFASAAVRRGEVTLDATINQDQHEDKIYKSKGKPGASQRIQLGDATIDFSSGYPRVAGAVHSMLAADGRLFVVTKTHAIHCFGSEKPETVAKLREETTPLEPRRHPLVTSLLERSPVRDGVAMVWGLDDPDVLAHLLQETRCQVIGFDADPRNVDRLRRALQQTGLYGTRISLHVGTPSTVELPPYVASLSVAADAGIAREWVARGLSAMRPYGGSASLHAGAQEPLVAIKEDQHPGLRREFFRDACFVERGELPGAANYLGNWESPDERVRAPLGVLWFDDRLGHFKRSPQPLFAEGVMLSRPKDWHRRHSDGAKPPYALLPEVYSDVYSGRVLKSDESFVTRVSKRFPASETPTSQYRPPYQTNAWSPKRRPVGERLNPLNGKKEPRQVPKSYGCDGGVDYGHLFTMRSGTPAFYDKRLESGTCSISGPRSGCTNSIIPACGVLNVPYFYEGCTCSYPLPVGLALVSRPAQHEQWASWGAGTTDDLHRVGLNFGAPGDRMTPNGTLWLDAPSRGGESPKLKLQVEPKDARYHYRHSLRMQGGEGWSWVAASGIEGATRLVLQGVRPGRYTIRLTFAELTHTTAGKRVFSVAVNHRPVFPRLDIVASSGGPMRGLVKTLEGEVLKDELVIEMTRLRGDTLLSGVELVADGLTIDPVSRIAAP